MNIASLTGAEIASRRPVSSAVAIARWSPSSAVRIARIDRIAQALHEGGDSAATGRRRRAAPAVLIAPMHKAGGADAGEIHVAAEIVAARAATAPSGGCSRAFSSTKLPTAGAVPFAPTAARARVWSARADFPCVATRSTKRSVRSRMSRVSTKPVSATEYIGRASTPCADPRGLPGRDRKAGGDRRDHHRNRKHLLPPQQERRRRRSAIAAMAATGSTGS